MLDCSLCALPTALSLFPIILPPPSHMRWTYASARTGNLCGQDLETSHYISRQLEYKNAHQTSLPEFDPVQVVVASHQSL